MSKVIKDYLDFTLLHSVIGLETSRPLLNQSDARTRVFPRMDRVT